MQKAKVNRKLAVWLLTTILLTPISLPEAQQTEKAHRIGYLSPLTPSSDSTRIEAFVEGCATSVTSRGRTSSSSTDMQRENPIGFPTLPRS
jgi:hypothetical protein